ncbi:MAG: hypothetical protein OXI86_17735, partial [Candidatus Poribacteria bacterium]|nr:hypothetical protein [Candidatus Poribacteria bacterium]
LCGSHPVWSPSPNRQSHKPLKDPAEPRTGNLPFQDRTNDGIFPQHSGTKPFMRRILKKN